MREDHKMLKRYLDTVIGAVALMAFSIGMRAGTALPHQPEEAKTHRVASVPRRDLSGIWGVDDKIRMEGISVTELRIARSLHRPGRKHSQLTSLQARRRA